MPNNARTFCITAAAGTDISQYFFLDCGTVIIFPPESVLQLNAFVTHKFSLGQAFAHCPRFLTAAPRRRSNLISVPMWLYILPNQLRIISLVRLYHTNNLIRHLLI